MHSILGHRRDRLPHPEPRIRFWRLFGILRAVSVAACLLTGCAKQLTRTLVDPSQASTLDAESPYLKVHLKNGAVLVLSDWRVDEQDRTCAGTGRAYDLARADAGSGPFTVSLDSVAVFETNVSRPAPVVAGLAVLTGVSLAVTAYCIANPKSCFGSCPTFYVTDGTRDVLQAEGFSSSVAPVLERTDVDALFRARPAGSSLRVRMTNEALETHMVRWVAVIAVPRGRGERIVATAGGEYFRARSLIPPGRAIAEEGDCAAALAAFDGIERVSPADSADLASRETIELTFPPVPAGPRGLVLGSRQSLLTTYLYYEALSALGTRAGDWLAALERGDPATLSRSQGIGDVLGGIDVLVQDQDGTWITAGFDRETGPIATDVRMIPLPGTEAGPVRVRLRLARGAWRLDLAALAALGPPVEPSRVLPARVRRDGRDDPDALAALLDPARTLVTFPGDQYELDFPLPGRPGEYEYFLESRGYYLEWMREEWLEDENPALAALMFFDPARALRVLAPGFKAQEAGMEAAFWGSRYARP